MAAAICCRKTLMVSSLNVPLAKRKVSAFGEEVAVSQCYNNCLSMGVRGNISEANQLIDSWLPPSSTRCCIVRASWLEFSQRAS